LLSRDTERLLSVRSYVARLRESQGLKPEAIIVQAPESEVLDRAPVWTDDFSDIYSVLKPIARESAGG
jgi:hypothetical protein